MAMSGAVAPNMNINIPADYGVKDFIDGVGKRVMAFFGGFGG